MKQFKSCGKNEKKRNGKGDFNLEYKIDEEEMARKLKSLITTGNEKLKGKMWMI